MENIYLPHLAEIIEITQETPDVKTLKLKFKEKTLEENFNYIPGQFIEFSVFDEGEATFCLSNSPARKGFIECSIKKTGKVSAAIHDLNVGDIVGIRGPYGNGFPVEKLKGKNLFFVGGGIGLAPLRSLINYSMDNRDSFKKIDIVNGARSSKDLVFKNEYDAWRKAEDTQLSLTIDCQEENWTCMVGVVPKIIEQLKPSCENTFAIVCGPPIMIRYTLPVLLKLGFCPESIITTLEMKMKCGLGKCGRCNLGNHYICKDGPVFNYQQLEALKFVF